MRGLPLSLTAITFGIPLTNAASTLLQGGTIISFDEASQTPLILRNHSLLVTDDRIASIFPSSSSRVPPQTTTIDVTGKILSPGFIDTHRHGWQTAFRTIASNTTLSEYAERYGEFSQAQQLFTPSDMYFGQFAGMLESLNAGVTSIVDHAHGTFSRETAGAYFNGTVDSGARVFWCYGIHDLQNGFSVNDQIEDFKELKNQLVSRGETVTTLGIAYDGFSMSSLDEIQTVMEFARGSNISVLTTHYLGGPWITANSPTLLNSFQPSFLNNTPFPIIFSHGSFMTAQDAVLLRQTNQYLSTTPESEMHYGHTHPHSFLIQDQASLGIDTHFTYSADMVTQARLWLQSTRLFLFSQVLVQDWEIPQINPMSVNQAFHLITRSGALALRRNDLGVLVEGAKADIVLFDGDSPNMLGWEDPVAAIILHSNVGDVTDVMVDGEWRKREGELVAKEGVIVPFGFSSNQTSDQGDGDGDDADGDDDDAESENILRAVRSGFLDSARRIQGLWAQMAIPESPGTFLGVPFGMPRREDVVRGDQDGY
ncbi:amidohydrolase family protein [Dendrothele bispora CBS 962.96]|uniref:Amidohydrolase family protein n=1 Tax=Dendrothele bispora (strain CBS 962.96) TaxID=1314807 RepID=A0A4S8MNN0_DENBC|nr:amidohydrolase family protein [Dendrothele bispora CBS 962.96]